MITTILSLATVTEMCSVAVLRGDQIVADHQCWLGTRHAEKLLPMIVHVMKEAALDFSDLDKIAVAKGPGSFTGIRIGMAAARGLALATSKPLLGVSSLEAIAQAVYSPGRGVLATLDARRGQIYAQSFSGHGIPNVEPSVMPPEDIGQLIFDKEYTVAGTGVSLVHPYLSELPGYKENIVFDETEGLPRASDVARAAVSQQAETSSRSDIRPVYLRPPDARRAFEKKTGIGSE